jgi:hypothetical protein
MRCAVLWLVLSATALPQSLLPPDVLLLSRIKRHVKEELARLPNISCIETVQREHQAANGKLRPLDSVRLEVLTNGSKELYAAPGERKFTEEHPIQFVGSGVIGDGFFGLFLKEVLVDGGVTYEYKGEEHFFGRQLARYDWRLPVMNSGHVINLQEGKGTVGMRGSFWADPHTYDVVRLEMNATDFPPALPIAEMETIVEYAPTRLGDTQSALLPTSGDFRLMRFSGEFDHNHIEFTHCRLCGAQSTISFGEPDTVSVEPARFGVSSNDDTLRPVPAGIQIAVKLASRITGDVTVGTLLEGTVVSVVAPKGAVSPIVSGARVRGRIRRLERYTSPVLHFVVAIECTEVESEGIRYRFYANLLELDGGQPVSETLTVTQQVDPNRTHNENLWLPKIPGVAAFFVRGPSLDLPPGFRITWRTLKP